MTRSKAAPSPVPSALPAQGLANEAQQGDPLARLTLRLPATADRVGEVRTCLRSLGLLLNLSEEATADLTLAVSEACTNVVLHAYPQGVGGPLLLDLAAVPAGREQVALTVLVRDRGRGLGPAAKRRRLVEDVKGLGVGLRLMRAVAQRVELRAGPSGATEVELFFLARRSRRAGGHGA